MKIKAVFFAALVCCNGSVADESDYVIVLDAEKSVEQVVSEQLVLPQFVSQIAAYNNISGIDTMLSVGTSLAIPQPYIELAEHGRVAYVKGDVTHKQTDLVVNPPVKGSQVYSGDIIQTGNDGFVSLTFRSGARVHVQPDSRVVVNNIDCVREDTDCVITLSATQGKVASDVTPREKGQRQVRFSIETPFLTAAVRGTAFYVDLEEGENRIGVTKGLVATDSSGQTNDLPQGKGLSVSEGVVPELVDLLSPPALSLTGTRLLFSAEDAFGWGSLNGAKAYQVDLAVDENMAERVNSGTTDELSFATPEVTPGDYYLTVAGIDSADFIGLPVKQKVSIAEVVDSDEPELVISRESGITALSVPDYNGRLELLISNSLDADNVTSRVLENAEEVLSMQLDTSKDWVFRARKVLTDYQVSPYSEYYVLSAQE